MKALSFNETGQPEAVLALVDVPKPTPGDHEVLVRVWGSPIHPADRFFIQGTYRIKPEFPQIAGLEGAGIIEATGKDVNLEAGTRVSFISKNAWAEYTVVPEQDLIVLPPEFPLEKAVQFCLNPFTAWGLLDLSHAQPGSWLLVTAASTTVSKIAIQLAKTRQIKIIAAVSNLNHAATLTALGADHVLDIEDEGFLDQVQTVTDGKGVDAVLESVGGLAGTRSFQSLAAHARVIIYGLLSPDPVQFYNAQIIYKNVIVAGFGIRGYLDSLSPPQKAAMITTLITTMAGTSFKLPVAKAYLWDQFTEALPASNQRNRTGKIIFRSNP